ncbi:MAG: hypothetical protein KIT84_36250 [Labilithrix sp.]|nr:hypothetical protein [Labilithrix sp.]MCW5816507.1 hypothetical protein [Labilithrix sp.]
MSGEDPKDVLGGLGDDDWDSALDDWEKNSFTPSIAPAVESTSAEVAPDAAIPPPPKSIPPPPQSAPKSLPPPPKSVRPVAFGAEPATRPRHETGSLPPDLPLPPEGEDETLLFQRRDPAPVGAPSESVDVPVDVPGTSTPDAIATPPPPPSPPSSARGGLEQLFSRQASSPRLDVPPAASTELGPFLDDSDETLIRPSAAPPAAPPPVAEAAPLPIPEPDEDATIALDDVPDDDTNELPAMRALPRAETEVAAPTLLAGPAAVDHGDTGESPSFRIEPESEGATLVRTSLAPLAPETTPDAPIVGSSSPWLDAARLDKWNARILWLEEEARSLEDDAARGRALLAVSELAAIAGDRERALAYANEAKAVAPNLPLASRQARQLLPRDPDLLVDALDAEASESPTSASRAHATLLAADILRANGDGDAAIERWDSACKLEPADPRAPVARAAIALAQESHASGALNLADNSELVAFDKAVATALRLRGVVRPGAEVEELPINDGLRTARNALTDGDVVGAAAAIGEIAAIPELAHGALWLSAAIGSVHIAARRAAARSLKTLAADDDPRARRQLAARGIELGDPELVTAALGGTAEAFSPAEHATVALLAASKSEPKVDVDTVAKLAAEPSLTALADAVTALAPMLTEDTGREAIGRSRRVSGKQETRALAALGRLLAAKEPDLGIDEALESIATPNASATGVMLESAVHGKRWSEVSETLSELGSDASGIAAAIVAERAGDRDRARAAWRAAAKGERPGEGVVRIAAELDPEVDLGAELLRIADDQPDGLGPAVLRLEALARGAVADDARAPLLERVHRAAPQLGIGAFLAERVARRKGDLDEVLRWIQERRAIATDPFENALDAVREALLVADRDPEIASRRLEEAQRDRPDDVALRELHERLAIEELDDRGAWRERRAAKAAATPAAAAQLWVEAAREHGRAGKFEEMRTAAKNAIEAGDRGLGGPLLERAELETGDTTRQTEELIEVTKTSESEDVRREAFERLADLDAFAKKDAAAALLWHQSILETSPRHLPSLRWVEQTLMTEGRDDELAPVFEQIALALDGTAGGEVTGHAQHCARLRAREGAGQPTAYGEPTPWEKTHDMARLAATQPEASLWSLRALNAHARLRQDHDALLMTTNALLERTQRPAERGTLLLRASEAAARLGRVQDARNYLEQAASEDPGDVVTWGFLAEVRATAGEPREAAEACESLARTSVVREHQLLAWHDAAKLWGDEVKDAERAMSALEAAAEIDPTYADVFPRLTALYAERRLDAELAHLLERRLEGANDDDERVALEVELARAFAEMGELGKAKSALESALEKRPDHTTALSAMAEVAGREGDWAAAESAYVRLARLLPDADEQRQIYERLGEIYAVHAPNLSRAEVAYKEVRKRAPDDQGVIAKLVDVYKRMGDVTKAVEAQQEIISAATDPDARLAALVELAKIHEQVGRDPRKSEQVLDSARKEFPTSVVALRAMAEFYARQRQMPAMQILLDRAAGDARRSFAQGRFVPSLFQVLHAAFELRGKRDAAKVVAATLAAVEGNPSELLGAEARAVDPRLDDLLAPELMSPALRVLFQRAGSAVDAVAAVDLKALKAAPLQPGTPIGATVGSVATVVGLGALQILVSPNLGKVAVPLATNPPTLLVGEPLARARNEAARMFVVVRALKMILSHASALVRANEQDIPVLVAALFTAFNPTYVPQGLDPKRHAELARRIGAALPRNVDPTVGVIALEAAGMVGAQWQALATAGSSWANRAALLAIGDPNGALEGIAWTLGQEGAPTAPEERAAWIARHVEARDLMTFSVTDAYSEARAQLGVDR